MLNEIAFHYVLLKDQQSLLNAGSSDFIYKYWNHFSNVKNLHTINNFQKWLCMSINALHGFVPHHYVHLFSFLYARLDTGRIMVQWCLFVCPSVRLSIHPFIWGFLLIISVSFHISSWNLICSLFVSISRLW
jgi:hypothetical protein